MHQALSREQSIHRTAPTPPASDWWANMRLRVATAAVLIPVVIILVWLGGWFTFAGVVVVLLLAMRELDAMFARRGWRPLTILSAALSVDMLVAARLPDARLLLLAIGVSCTVVAASVWLMAARPVRDQTLVEWALTLAVPFYLGWPLAFVIALRGEGVGPDAAGYWWLLLLLLAVWANDSGALIVGHFFGRAGRHLLAPRISPKKTWEGVAGGAVLAVVAVVVVASIAARLSADPLAGLAWYLCIILGALIAAAATLGDLSKSLLKRVTGVKDSGKLLPGHGGMLDRCDSTLFAVFVVAFYALALGVR